MSRRLGLGVTVRPRVVPVWESASITVLFGRSLFCGRSFRSFAPRRSGDAIQSHAVKLPPRSHQFWYSTPDVVAPPTPPFLDADLVANVRSHYPSDPVIASRLDWYSDALRNDCLDGVCMCIMYYVFAAPNSLCDVM